MSRRAVIAIIAVVAVVLAGLAAWLMISRRGGNTTLVPAGAQWRYNDTGKDLGIDWRLPDYDDSTWPQGAAPLGYGQVVVTQIEPTADPKNRPITTYYRTEFAAPSQPGAVQMRIRRDDGAVVYINGTEVMRTGIAPGVIAAKDRARFDQDDGSRWIEVGLPGTVVAPGRNVVAVEVHQHAPDSSDSLFDLELTSADEPRQGNAAPAPGAVRVLAAGDIGECGGAAPETASLVAQQGGPFLAMGDIAYPKGRAEDYKSCYDPSYGQFLDRTFPVPGNHDYMTDGAKPYFAYFGKRVGTPAAPWYSGDIGGWHIVYLNSNCEFVGGCDEASPQYKWLKADLASNPSKCLAALWHHPRYSSSEYGDNTEVQPLYRAMVEAGGDLVLNGHAHLYERYGRMGADDNPAADGMREFIVGTGGANLYPFAKINPNSEVRWNQGYGVLQLDLGADGYSWRYLSTDDAMNIDSGADTC